jgi:ATP-dependent RNA helicase RhlE
VQRQNLLFSATFPDEIRKLAGSFMKDPATVEVARRNTPAELVAQVQHPVDSGRKRDLLAHLVKTNDWKQVLVFVKTKHGANRLAQQLTRAGVEADAIHGNKSQNARTRALEQFKAGEMRVLVATDIAARGLDIEALPHVVNYDLPHVAEDYVHRIGRTGRAGSEGEAVTLVSHEDRPLMAAIERLMNRKVEQRVVPGFEPGSAPSTPHREEGRHEGQRPPRREGQRHGRQPQKRPDAQRPQQRPPQRAQQRPQQQQQQRNRPQQPRPPQDSAYEDQIREARARMREEGENVPPRENRENRGNGGGNGSRPNRGAGQGNRRNRQPNRPQARSSRAQQWDPRRSEPREPGYANEHKPNPSRPAPVVQVKQRRTIGAFVGALLGRKTTEDEKS